MSAPLIKRKYQQYQRKLVVAQENEPELPINHSINGVIALIEWMINTDNMIEHKNQELTEEEIIEKKAGFTYLTIPVDAYGAQ